MTTEQILQLLKQREKLLDRREALLDEREATINRLWALLREYEELIGLTEPALISLNSMTSSVLSPPTHKPTTFSALVPFAGFYYTCHEELIDDAQSSLFQGDDGEIFSQRLYEEFRFSLNHGSVFEHYAKAYVEVLARAVDIQLDYEEMVSPREYNFTTDRIFAKISRSDLARILRAVRGPRLNQKAHDWFTSRSGFISSYPNHPALWPRIRDWDHNHVGCALECYLDFLREQGDLPDENVLAWEGVGMDEIGFWLEEAANQDEQATRTAGRALKLSDYLRRRQERRYRRPPQQ